MRFVFGTASRCLGVFLCLFGTLDPSVLAAQGTAFTAGTTEQIKASATLVGPESPGALEGSLEGRAGDDSQYNWGAAWLGMGIGAVVGAGVGLLILGPSEREAPPEAYALGGAILFGIVGFFVGYAIGNHD